ncbi:TPA: DUF4113 domain-containing protein, partial [Escherichia coli]|nr:DUF4113 domain-containing protein [Escherichia coli]
CLIANFATVPGIAPSWQMKRDMLSPAYTTRWRDIPVARIG